MPQDPVEQLLKAMMGVVASNKTPEEMERLQKDLMPSAGRPTTGRIYDGGPFSALDTDIYSLTIGNSSPLTEWLPTRAVTWLNDEVQHLAWGAFPAGFDGSQTYADWLSGITIDPCGYGPAGTNWDGFRYTMSGGKFSFTSDMMSVPEDSGLTYWENSPRYTIRGGNGALNGIIDNDADWAISMLLQEAQQHVDYINIYGSKANSVMEWDGLSQIIKPGYVQSKLIGTSQSAAMADPLWMNGIGLGSPTDPALLLKVLNSMVRNRRNYARQRNWRLDISDCALLMHSVVLEMLQQAQAAGAGAYWENYFGEEGRIIQTLDGYEARLERLRNQKVLRLDGVDIPVLVEDNLGFYGSITIGGTPTTTYTGDIFWLVKQVNGNTVLENRFVDWSKLNYPFKGTDEFREIQGGIARTGWVDESKKCYYYFLEMYGRMVCMMMPMQARITNVTIVPNNELDLSEQTAFWAPNTAAYNGARGGGGVPLLVGQRTV